MSLELKEYIFFSFSEAVIYHNSPESTHIYISTHTYELKNKHLHTNIYRYIVHCFFHRIFLQNGQEWMYLHFVQIILKLSC